MRRQINGIELSFTDTGSGPAILFAHGFPFDHTMWASQTEALERDYRLIAPDLRGHGQSEAPLGPYSMDQMATDLHALLQILSIEHAVLIGLSMGGYIALAFWRLYPHLVRALVLSDTKAAADTAEGRENRYAMIGKLREEGSNAVVEGMLPKLLSPSTLEAKPDVVEHVRHMMTSTPVNGMIGALEGMAARVDSSPTLETINVPTLIVVGEDDAITPQSDAEAMYHTILAQGRTPNVLLARIKGAGHLAPLENPTDFNLILRNFLVNLDD